MASNNTITTTIKILGDVKDFESGIKNIQGALNQLHLSGNLKGEFNTLFADLDKEIKNIQSKTQNDRIKLVDEKSVSESVSKVGDLWKNLITKLNSEGIKTAGLEKYSSTLDQMSKVAKTYTDNIASSDKGIKEATKAVEDQIKEVRILQKEQEKAQKNYDETKVNVTIAEAALKQAKAINAEEDEKLKILREQLKTVTDRINAEKEAARQQYTQDKDKGGGGHKNLRGFDSQFNSQHKQELQEIADLEKQVAEAEEKAGTQAAARQAKIDQATEALAKQNAELDKAKTRLDATNASYDSAQFKLNEFSEKLKTLEAGEFEKIKDQVDAIDWSKFEDIKKPTNFEELQQAMEQLARKSQEEAMILMNQLKPSLEQAGNSAKNAKKGLEESAKSLEKISDTTSQLDVVKNRLLRFFSIDNAIRLFRRAIRSAIDTVKDLDKVMTETAVVTNFSVADMWKQLPDYTARANELGVTIHDVYEASTLYYQQGLKTNEVMQITTATLRMARIAGLEASEATDRMTNALRGFNMEINEANADNIADVYSKLAAISASNVDEISTAMTKVASLANSANMSFENTAAFLSQIIETTRESAETAGTALKTVVARFSEVKEAVDQGTLVGDIVNIDGEEVNVNKVAEALRLAGINLNEFLIGSKGLDEIFMELASKWDSLDIVQQRYIATMAAGSRQQSRFIALMSDYERMQELTGAATNATGASMEQYNKTLESLETKLSKLQNAWNEFLMTIADNTIIKGAVDFLTQFITTINQITGKLPGALSGLSKLLITFMAFKGLRAIFNGLFNSFGQKLGLTTGKNAAMGWINSFKNTIQANGGGIKGAFKSLFTEVSGTSEAASKDMINNFQAAMGAQGTKQQRQEILTIYETQGYEAAKAKADEYQIKLNSLEKETKEFAGMQQQTTLSLQKVGGAFMAVGGAIAMLSQVFDDGTKEGEKRAKTWSKIGIIISGVGMALSATGALAKAAGISISTSMWAAGKATAESGQVAQAGWGWISLIMIAITAVVAGTVALVSELKKASPEGKLKAAQEAADQAAKAAEKAKTAYDDLTQSFDNLNEKYTTIENMTKYTNKWYEAVREVNEEVLKLLETYSDLDVWRDENGILHIDQKGASKVYFDRANLASINSLANQKAVPQQEMANAAKVFNDKYGDWRFDLSPEELAKKVKEQGYTENDLLQEAYKSSLSTSAEEDQKNKEFLISQGLLKDLQVFGEALLAGEGKLDSYNASLGQVITSTLKYQDEEAKWANTFLNNDLLEQYTTKFKKDVDTGYRLYENNIWDYIDVVQDVRWGNERKKIQSYGYNTFEAMDKQTEMLSLDELRKQFALSQGYKEYKTWKKAHDDEDATRDEMVNAVAAKKGMDLAAEATQKFVEAMKSAPKDIQQFFADYTSISTNQFSNIFGFDLKDITGNPKSFLEEHQQDIIDLYKTIYGVDADTTDDLYKIFEDQILNEVYEFKGIWGTATSNLTKMGLDNLLDNSDLDVKTAENLGNQFIKYFSSYGTSFGKTFNDKLSTLNLGENTNKFLEQFSMLDLKNEDDLNNFKNILNSLDIKIDSTAYENFINYIKEIAHTIPQIDLSNLNEQTKDLAKLSKSIQNKENDIYSEDEYKKLIEYNIANATDFQVNEDGEYVLLGKTQVELLQGISEYLSKITGETKEQLQNQNKAKDVLKDIQKQQNEEQKREKEQGSDSSKTSNNDKEVVLVAAGAVSDSGGYGTNQESEFGKEQEFYNSLDDNKKFLFRLARSEDIDLENTPIADLKAYSNEELSELDSTRAADIVKEFIDWATDPTVSEKLAGVLLNEVLANLASVSNKELAENFEGNEANYRVALITRAASILPSETYQSYKANQNWSGEDARAIADLIDVYSEAEKLGYDKDIIEVWANQLGKTNEELAKYPAVAAAVAIANTKLNKGVSDLISNWEKVEDLFSENGPLGKNTGRPLQFTSSEQNEAYQTMKKNLEIALDLDQALSDNFFDNSKNIELLNDLINGTAEAKEQALEGLRTAAALDVVLNDESITTDVQNDLVNLISTLDIPDLEVGAQLNNEPFINSLRSMLEAGDLTVEQLKAILNGMGLDAEIDYTKKVYVPAPDPDADVDWSTGLQGKFKEVPLTVPQIRYVFSKGNGVGKSGLSAPNLNNTGKKSGGGKESKKKDWKNPYDELYNLQEHINSALREREKLEADYQRMLEDHRTVGEDLQKQSMKEIASLQKQLYYQKQMMAGRKKQMANVLNETYEDSEGNRKTYGSMGLQKYAWYEEDTQTVHIEWDKINQVTDEDQGKAIEAYVSRLEELRDKMQDVEDAIDEANDQIREIQMRNTEEYIDFEQRVYDALVNQYQKEIDMLGEINQSVTDATNKTLDAISEEIEKERQARENEKAREELSDKEARLAYLQRDTSGMNALEIQKLQQELENERQSYQDSIVDQTLQEMRDEAARAEAQRQAQIDMMQGQLDWWQEVGYPLWERVETLIDGGVDETGKLVETSELAALLKDNDNIKAISEIQAFKWRQDLAKEVAAQFEGFANWKMEMARDAGEVTVGKNKYTYHPESNTWTGPDGKEYNVYYRNGQYVAEKVQKPKDVPVGSGAPQPGGGGTGGGTNNGPGGTQTPPPYTPPTETTLSDNDKKAFAALYLAGYYNQESLANEIGKNNAGQSIAYGHGNNYLYDLFTQAVGGNTKWQSNSSWKKYIKGNTTWKKYAQGGLADFTGPAWLDGTKSHPEMVLNATDTQNLITLKNILGAILQNANSASKTSTGDNYFDINIDAQISSDYDVDQLSERIKKQIYDDASYRNVNTLHYIR